MCNKFLLCKIALSKIFMFHKFCYSSILSWLFPSKVQRNIHYLMNIYWMLLCTIFMDKSNKRVLYMFNLKSLFVHLLDMESY